MYPFLKLVEQVIHQLMEKAIEKQLAQLGPSVESNGGTEEWSSMEEQRLEHGFRLYKVIADDSKWKMISETLETKNPS